MGKGIPIHVLGTHFTIQTDESPDYVEQLVKYVTQKIESLEKTIPTKDMVRLSVLASILIADELFKERHARGHSPGSVGTPSPTQGAAVSSEVNELESITDGIIARLDAALEN